MQRNGGEGAGLYGPGSLACEKNTKITEALHLQLRVDAFDFFNHPNLLQPWRYRFCGVVFAWSHYGHTVPGG